MNDIENFGYHQLHLLSTSGITSIFSAKRKDDNTEVIIKQLSKKHPSQSDINHLLHEHRMMEILQESSAVPQIIELIERGNIYSIVMEKIPYLRARQLLNHQNKMNLSEFLSFAIACIEALESIHSFDIIHKNFNTVNILYNKDNNKVKVTDFALAMEVITQKPADFTAELLEGTLAYISPEQTARMGHSIDYRSDYYSLGITLYEILTGCLPFEGKDANELIYAHIAIMPRSPNSIDSDIPEVLSNIIMKMIEKEPSKRYQSAVGILYDLNKCKKTMLDNSIELFQIAQKDISKNLKPSEKIYGRIQEINQILARYERVISGKSGLVFIRGSSGIGKTSLVNEINKSLLKYNGHLVSGNYEQLKRTMPYFAIAQALDRLIKEILTKNAQKIDEIKETVLAELGDSIKLMIDFIPALSHLVGEKENFDIAESQQSHVMFNNGLIQLLKSLASQSMPITLFLDNLQWADIDSFDLIKSLVLSKIPYLLIIGAYRDNEVDDVHSLSRLLREFNALDMDYDLIKLTPLHKSDINEYLSDSLHRKDDEIEKLSEVMYNKTLGNPFFLQQLLITLSQQKIIHFDSSELSWNWDIDKVKQQKFSDNVIELLINNMKSLDKGIQDTLSAAACMGSVFSIEILANILNKSIDNLLSEIKILLKNGYVFTKETQYYQAREYHFYHDRIKQAAYELLNKNDVGLIHLLIAKELYFNHLEEDDLFENIFNITDHFNCAFVLENKNLSQEEVKQIIDLNIKSAKEAQRAAAFSVALNYYEMSLKWIGDEDWPNDYQRLIKINIECMKCSLLSNQIEKMEFYKKKLDRKSNDIESEHRIVKIYSDYLLSKKEFKQVISNTLDLFKKVGLPLSQKPGFLGIIYDYFKTRFVLRKVTSNDLNNLSEISNLNIKIIFTHIDRLNTACYLGKNIRLMFKLACIYPRLLFKYGFNIHSSPLSSYAILERFLGRVPSAIRWAEMACTLSDKKKFKKDKVILDYQLNYFVFHQRDSLKDLLKRYLTVYEQGVHIGSSAAASYAIWSYHAIKYYMGSPCLDLLFDLKKIHKKLSTLQEYTSLTGVEVLTQAVHNLSNEQSHKTLNSDLIGTFFDEKNNKLEFFSYSMMLVLKLQLAFLLDKRKVALDIVEKIQSKYKKALVGSYFLNIFKFYQTLVYISIIPSIPYFRRFKIKFIIRRNLRLFKQYAQYCPDTYLSKYLLLKACWFQINNKRLKAEILFEKAIEYAKKGNLLSIEAIANELAARFHMTLGRKTMAKSYLIEAYHCYQDWQVFQKIKQLKSEFPEVLSTIEINNNQRTATVEKNMALNTKTLKVSDASLNINSIQKSVEVISSTMVMDELLSKLLNLLIENAGAEHGCLLLPKNDIYYIEAQSHSAGKVSHILNSIPITSELLPDSVLQYVIRSKSILVLDNAHKNKTFHNDPYIKSNLIKSVLCMPLVNKNKITAVLYLENNIIGNAFTTERCQHLSFLSAQIATSIDNAKLYTDSIKHNDELTLLNEAYQRFVPKDFITLLGKESVTKIKLGDFIESDMTIMFADIRDFTKLSESMRPAENFSFINDFLAYMEPIIKKHHGFIDKYIGDAIMALFPGGANDALDCAIEMLNALIQYNLNRQSNNKSDINIGIGINTGKLILGTVGTQKRMDGTVISDAVNIASRVESLNKKYQTNLLLTKNTYKQLKNPDQYHLKEVDKAEIRGKLQTVTVYGLLEEKISK